jgi:hypothetical protein
LAATLSALQHLSWAIPSHRFSYSAAKEVPPQRVPFSALRLAPPSPPPNTVLESIGAFIALLLGLHITLAGFLMLMRKQAMLELVPKSTDNPALTYILGSMRVLIGLAIILPHNAWVGTLGTFMIILVWITLLRGLAMLTLPIETERKLLASFTRDSVWNASAIVAMVLSACLAYAGFTA